MVFFHFYYRVLLIGRCSGSKRGIVTNIRLNTVFRYKKQHEHYGTKDHDFHMTVFTTQDISLPTYLGFLQFCLTGGEGWLSGGDWWKSETASHTAARVHGEDAGARE